ncbi:MAG: SGNH/GDSL hydrolase family protein [Candidatus Eremiobacteraeota bacterium]|nr:SGNH/GDSL hydrolase family protein [Candidatus Eremiobacteraeota bacterium]
MRQALKLVFLLLLPVALLVHNTRDGLKHFQALFDINHYLFNLFLWLWIAFGCLMVAFALRHKRVWPGLFMLCSTLCLTIGLLDLMVLLFSTESSGPAGHISISHRNWQNRTVQENALGFWDDEVPARIDVAVVGDSFTWGQGIPARKFRFTDVLSEKTKIKFWNFGRPGASTQEETEKILPIVAAHHPKTVFLCYLTNDIACEYEPFDPPVPSLTPFQRSLLQASPTYNYAYLRFFGRSNQNDAGLRYFYTLLYNYWNEQSMAHHSQEIAKMVEKVRAMGAQPVAIILPFPHMFYHVQPEYRKKVYDAVGKAFRDAGAPVLELQDLEDTFPVGQFEAGPIDSHPSARVNEAMAERIAAWLKEHREVLP